VPRKKLPMRKITEVLRLNAQGRSQRQIALSTGMSKTAVRDYLSLAAARGHDGRDSRSRAVPAAGPRPCRFAAGPGLESSLEVS
jgi:transposase